MADDKISGSARFHMDAYGYATLAAENPTILNPAMREMYSAFLDENDPIINKILSESNMAQRHLMAKRQYDATPEDQRGDAKDPGKPDQKLMESLQILNASSQMYMTKRQGILYDLTTTQAIDYFSRKDGSLIVDTPDNVRNLIEKASGKLKDLSDDQGKMVLGALNVIDEYKIHGDLNNRVQKSIARRNLEMMN